ncbi:hypothetical protein [Psychroserpens sp. SPM9]|uniref:hypothetical protein n=1 Tax=Psychroserpens sp. SPM9 TaxID=2975598 RepID=UPI0021A8CC51|nr:hypothetical protein [Psychroserpens sp. SPM9]MDG5491760.1 hypothetical protein [Psychroserpens sp. SPM9]
MKQLRPLLLVLSLFTVTSCEDFLDCVINRRPELPDKSFRLGVVNSYYYDEFDAQIKNEPRDNDYGYEFEIHGDLPEGLSMIVNYRTVSIEGLPTHPGTYSFTVVLYVNPPINYDADTDTYDDPLCSESTSKDYTIRIDD